MTRDPRSIEYKKAYLNTRERAVYAWLEQADRLAGTDKRRDAEKLYQRVLTVDPGNDRAHAGLQNAERDQRHAQLLQEGQTALAKGDLASARLKLSTVITENPNSDASRLLQRTLADKAAPVPAESTLAAAYRKPLTIEFKDVALKQVFEVIARTSGLNFLFDKDVKMDQKTSIFLKNSTIESAVHFTLLTNQLEQQVLDANTILIYPNTAAKLKDYQEMVVKSFFLTNAEAKTVAATLKTILKSRDIVVDDKLNMLIVRDSPDAIRLAEKLVALHDVPEPEVMLEVEILEVKRTRLLELGIQWPNSLTLTPLPSATGGILTLRDLRTNINGATIGAGIGPVTARARKEDGDTNLLANPRIRTRNREKAKIVIGERVPNITTTIAPQGGFASDTINYIDVGLTLNVEPTIHLDNEVAIKISLEVSSLGNQIKSPNGSTAFQIGNRSASTVLRLKDGENQVLAGLINDEDRRSGNKIPGFGELPIIGRLFGSTTDDNQKTEIVLSITPHLIRNIRRPDAAQSEFRAGTDSSFRNRPDSVAGGAANVAIGSPAAAVNSVPAIQQAVPAIHSGSNTAENNLASPANNAATTVSGGAMGNAATAPGATTLQWQGPTQLNTDEAFEVQLMMQSNQPVTSVPMTLSFDPQVFRVIGIAEGTFLKQDGAQTGFTSSVDPTGKIQLNATRAGSGGATNLASVAILSFRTLAPVDATSIEVLTAAPLGVGGRPIAVALPPPKTVKVQ